METGEMDYLLNEGDIAKAVHLVMKEKPSKDYPRMPWSSFNTQTFKEAMRQEPDDNLIDCWAENLRLMAEDRKERVEILRKLICDVCSNTYNVNCNTICTDGGRLIEKLVNYLITLAKSQGHYSQEYTEVYLINHKKNLNTNEKWHD